MPLSSVRQSPKRGLRAVWDGMGSHISWGRVSCLASCFTPTFNKGLFAPPACTWSLRLNILQSLCLPFLGSVPWVLCLGEYYLVACPFQNCKNPIRSKHRPTFSSLIC